MNLSLITTLIGLTAATVCAQLPQAEIRAGGTWLPFASKTLDSRPDYTVNPANLELSKYGGWLNGPRQTATGFFRVEKINGRWWAIDPEGYLFIHMALNSVSLEHQSANQIYAMMREHGFNGFGNWTWNGPTGGGPAGRSVIGESTVKNTTPMAYTPRILFIGNYRNERLPAGTPRIELPVFDPGFATKAFDYAQGFLPFLNDPQVFGYFTDNELPFRYVLSDHLAVTNTNDPNYVAAFNFLAGRGKSPSNWDQADADAYMALAGERYYSVVHQAIRSVDTNHMILGSRCHSAEKGNQAFMEKAGPYVDIFSANHYNHWGNRSVETKNMSEWSGRPLMFTEFYVMSSDGGLSTDVGAGFSGMNQASRALFYQNFVSTLAESGHVVGFHWFKYGDGDNNTGVINNSGVFYTELLNSMKQMNTRMYDFMDYADSLPAPDAVLAPEADAYFEGGTNRGGESNLLVKYASSPGISTFRQIYMRFDVSSLENQIASAKIVLRSLAGGNENGVFRAELVANNSWGETTIRNSNAPAGSTVLHTFSDGGSDLAIDVSSVIGQALAGDGKLSIRIIGTESFDAIPNFGSREHPDPVARPVLVVDYPNRVHWDGTNGTWGDAANWSTDAAATTPNPPAAPGDFEDVVFNISGQNANQTVNLNMVNRIARSMTFSSPGTTFFQRDSANAGTNNISLGAGGLTMKPGTGAVTVGDSNQRIELMAKTSLSITNDSSSLLQFNSPVYSAASYTTTTLTLDGAGLGGVEFNTPINNGSSINALTALNINTTGGFTILRNGSSNFSGEITLTQGVLAARASNSLGSGTFTINGGTFGTVVSNRSFSNSLVINNDFQLGGANVPGLVNSNPTFGGPVNLRGGTRTITLANNATFNGVISNGGLAISANPTSRILTLGGDSTYTGPTNVNAGTLIINGNNSAATGQISVAASATLGGNGTIGAAVIMAPGGGLSARITDWTGAAGTGHDDLAVASLDAGGGALNLVVTTTGLTNFTETNRSFTILNTTGGITNFNPANVTFSTTGFSGTGTWSLSQAGNSLVLNYAIAVADPYLTWATGAPYNLVGNDALPDSDPDFDGITNSVEFVIGTDPTIASTSVLPTGEIVGSNLVFTCRLSDLSAYLDPTVQYGSDLSGWTTAEDGVGGVTIGAPTDLGGGIKEIVVTIPMGANTKLFARLNVVVP